MLSKLTIQQFRGFHAKQVFKFAIPNGVKNGSGLTIIVGPNNSGKTTFIEALTFHNDDGIKRFNQSERHARPPVITLTDNTGQVERITNVSQGAQVQFVNDVRLGLQIEFIASRRQWESQYSGQQNHSQFTSNSNKNVRKQGDPGTAQRLATINLIEDERNELTELMKRLVPNFSFWTVDSREPAGDYIKYRTGGGAEHAVDMLGDGIISLFRICAHLIGMSNDSVLVIDEPELSLHPWAQKELHTILSEYSKYKQIIIVTHSPHFVDWHDFLNGAQIIRLNKPMDRACIVSTLDHASSYATLIGREVRNWQKPELLDVVAKEIMFADKILFVEGKEDMGLLRKWLLDSTTSASFDIFGYGVGGETSMELFLKLSVDLGLVKVGVLFDHNATTYRQCKANYLNYKVERISTDDIRDKFEGRTQTKTGIFDRRGRLKSTKKSELVRLINDYNSYFLS